MIFDTINCFLAHKTHQGIIVKFGPSGWQQIHTPRFCIELLLCFIENIHNVFSPVSKFCCNSLNFLFLFHKCRYATEKGAIEAAARASRGKGNSKVFVDDARSKTRIKQGKAREDDFNKNLKGDHNKHVHSSDSEGNRLKDGIHRIFPS